MRERCVGFQAFSPNQHRQIGCTQLSLLYLQLHCNIIETQDTQVNQLLNSAQDTVEFIQ